MLKSHFNSSPPTKFILIEDTVANKGRDLLNYLTKNASQSKEYSKIYYCMFERDLLVNDRDSTPRFQVEDFSNWRDAQDFRPVLKQFYTDSLVVVNSLAHLVLRYGCKEAYQMIHYLLHRRNVKQVLTLLHTDLFLDDSVQKCFEHLSTFHLELEEGNKVSYLFKKSARKIHKGTELLRIDRGNLINEKLAEVKVQQPPPAEIKPEELSTFKIGLSNVERRSRDNNLVLPYLPKQSGDIEYTFDDVDDWDEEDPDDDLDI